ARELAVPLRARAGGADGGHAAVVAQRVAQLGAADRDLAQAVAQLIRHVTKPCDRLAKQRIAGAGAERRLVRRLPDQGVAADERERGVPRPHRDREVERRDNAGWPERMPGFEHAVARPLAGNDLAVELARQADREIADIDHLLHFALTLLDDLAGFDRDEAAERGFVAAQFLGEEA